jgi:hypothetical protein
MWIYLVIDTVVCLGAGFGLKTYLDRGKIASANFATVIKWLEDFAQKSEVQMRREAELLKVDLRKLL